MSKKIKFNKEEILKLYIEEKIPLSKIAKMKNVCYKTMQKFFIENKINITGRISANKFLSNKEWLIEQYSMGKGLQSIANLAKSTRGNVYYAMKKAGIEFRGKLDRNELYNRIQIGEKAGNYKGGRRKAGANGRYIQILSHNHPNRDQDGYVMEHRLVLEKKIGRYLTKDEIVHHLDGNGHNNKIENLELTTRKKHFKNHFDAVKKVEVLEGEIKRLNLLLLNK